MEIVNGAEGPWELIEPDGLMEKAGMVYGSDFDHPSIPELSPLRRHILYLLKRANWHEKPSSIRILV